MKNFKKLMAFGLIALSVAQVHSMSRFMPKVAGLLAASSALALRAAPASVDQDSKSEPTHTVTLYRACHTNRLGQLGSCDKRSAAYMRRLKATNGSRSWSEAFKDFIDGVKPFASEEKAIHNFFDAECDKYDMNLAAGFEIKDKRTGKIVVQRKMRRDAIESRITTLSSVISVSADLTPKDANSEFDIYYRYPDNPEYHQDNDRYIDDTVASITRKHYVSGLTSPKPLT